LLWILSIDNPRFVEMGGALVAQWDSSANRWGFYANMLYPLLIGLAFIAGASQIGKIIGRAIDKSLECPEDNEAGKSEEEKGTEDDLP